MLPTKSKQWKPPGQEVFELCGHLQKAVLHFLHHSGSSNPALKRGEWPMQLEFVSMMLFIVYIQDFLLGRL